jgi:hypothetical protein
MGIRTGIEITTNFLVIAALAIVGFRLFAQYHSRGRWAKNVTSLLAGIGAMMLSAALMLTPRNAAVLAVIARTKAYLVLLIGSNALLLAAIAAFGVINYWRPARLLLERKIERELKSELPKVP